MIDKNNNNIHKKSVYDWWNSEYTKKWHNLKYDKPTIRCFNKGFDLTYAFFTKFQNLDFLP